MLRTGHSVKFPFFPCLGQARHDPAPALRAALAGASTLRRSRLRLFASASSTISARTRAGCRRRRSMLSAPARAPRRCDSGRWALLCRSIIRCGWRKKSPSLTRFSAGAWSSGSCRASTPTISSRSASTTICASRQHSNSSNICARPTAKSSRSPFTATFITPSARSSPCSRCRSRTRRYG